MKTAEPIQAPPRKAMAFCEVRLTSDPIQPPPDSAPTTGARLDFLGIVRPSENDRPLAAIDYSFHPELAARELTKIVAEAAAAHPLIGCRLIHRIGRVPAGETSLFLRIDTAHRDPAYTVSRWIIEQLKLRAPIWKHPIYADCETTPGELSGHPKSKI